MTAQAPIPNAPRTVSGVRQLQREQAGLTVKAIAKIAYESQRAYNQVMGNYEQQPWDRLPEPFQQDFTRRVQALIDYPGAPPSTLHDRWLAELLIEGWTHGAVIDEKKKINPRIIPWSLLPAEERLRDVLLQRVVEALCR